MIAWDRVEGFDWDEGNERKGADKYRVSRAEAEQIFFNEPLLVVEDTRHSAGEPRLHALGRTDDNRMPHVTFAMRRAETLIRVISARPMHRKERLRYEEEG